MANGLISGFPPKIYSVREPGYNPEIGNLLRVHLNGVEVRDTIEYDMEAGFIIRARRDPDGNLVFNRATEEFEIERVEGVVTVDWVD